MRLGELLIGERLIDHDQLAAALHLQSQVKERLGTCLVQLGFIDVDTIARALSGQQRVPAVLTKHFAYIEPNIIKLFTPRFAAEHHAIPLGYTTAKPARLVVACRDPHTAPIDEIAFIAGTRVDAGIAPELAIRQCLVKYYATKGERDQAFLDVDVAAIYSRSSMPPSPEPVAMPPARALSPHAEAEAEAAALAYPVPMPAPPVTSLSVPPLPMPSAPSASQPEDFTRRETLPEEPVREEPFREEADLAPPSETGWDDAGVDEGPSRLMTAPPGALHRVLGLEEAIAALRAATSRDEIGDVLVDYLRSTFGCGLVLIVKSGMALGWKGFAPDAEPDLIESIAMPLGAPSMLAIAHEQRATFRGPPPEEGKTLQVRLWKVLRCEPPREVVVAPVVLSTRVVNLLYAHAEGVDAIPESAASDLSELAAVASGEFMRIIRSKK